MRKQTLFLGVTILLSTGIFAQVPDTAPGRQLTAWMKAQDSGDRATIQQFIEKNMPWGRADQEIAIHNQTGGFEVKRVESSSDTELVVLAQGRAPGNQFVRISLTVQPAEPHRIEGIRVAPTQPPADLAPPKLTAAQKEAARATAPF